jgi:hypothetical protein
MLCRKSYEKEKELPQKKDFVCRKLSSDYINKYPNIRSSLTPPNVKLGKIGKRIISYYIKNNNKNVKIMREKDDFLYNYYHSKPFFGFNPWKFSNHIIKEFSRVPIDKINSYSLEVKTKPKYMVKPFRRPKIYSDYFDKNVY